MRRILISHGAALAPVLALLGAMLVGSPVQADGEFLGERIAVELEAVPDALSVLA